MTYSTSITPASRLITVSQHPASINILSLQCGDIHLDRMLTTVKMRKESGSRGSCSSLYVNKDIKQQQNQAVGCVTADNQWNVNAVQSFISCQPFKLLNRRNK